MLSQNIAKLDAECTEPTDYLTIRRNLTQFIQKEYYKGLGSLSFPTYFLHGQHPNKDHQPLAPDYTSKIYGKQLNCTKEKENILRPPSRLRNRRSRDTMGNLHCPWDVVAEFNPLRLPATIAKARCACDECLSRDSLSSGDSIETECREINSLMPVIRKQCVDSIYEYFVKLETVPVGCACQRKED